MVYIFKHGNIVYDGSTLTEKEKSKAVLVIDELPEKKEVEGKIAVLKYDVETQQVWYEYVEPKNNDELSQINERLKKIEKMLESVVKEDVT